MTRGDLVSEYQLLRQSLRTFVGEDALEEISVQIPADHDEAGFLRLIAWSYVFVFEAGRISIPYLLKIRSAEISQGGDLQSSCELIHDLRTWSFHNLSFLDARERGISKRTALWFINVCGTNPPNDRDGWRQCFERLHHKIYLLVSHCRRALELAITESELGANTVEDLRRRLDRNWPAHKFDECLTDVVARIGQSLDVPKFRQPRLTKWREYLATIPEGDEPESSLVRLIERDVLDHFGAILPIDGRDIMQKLDLPPGPEVGLALIEARRLHNAGVIDKDELLNNLAEKHSIFDPS